MKYRTILLVGAPGSGKGTQGKILGTVPDFYHCACGDVFRNLTIDSELGRIFIKYSSKGKLVPDRYTIQLWRENIEAQTQLGRFHPERDTLVLDGIPRNRHQAEMLHDALEVVGVLNLVCRDTEKLVERLQRRALRDNRLDDVNIELIKKRLAVYEKETTPVLDYYGPGLVHTIDSTQTPVNVLRDILRVITIL
jgi:adenylate kinase